MTKRTLMHVFVLACIVGIVYMVGKASVERSQAAAELDRAKAELMGDARVLAREAGSAVISGWREAAYDFVDEYDKGRVDHMYEVARENHLRHQDPSGYGLDSYEIVAIKTRNLIRDSVMRELAMDGDYPITDEKIGERMNADPRIKRLYAISQAKHQVYLCARAAGEAASEDELAKIQSKFEVKKKALVRLLKTHNG